MADRSYQVIDVPWNFKPSGATTVVVHENDLGRQPPRRHPRRKMFGRQFADHDLGYQVMLNPRAP